MATTSAQIADSAPGAGQLGHASVVICAYTERRWSALARAVASAQAQQPAPREVIVVIDHNPELLARAQRELAGATVLANTQQQGLSGARNTGVARADGEIVLFLDDDAEARPGWLAELLAPFADPTVIGAGGTAVPVWESTAPGWLPAEFFWVIGCSYRGVPRTRTAIRNPIGANMAFRRAVLIEVGGFSDGIGRVGRTPLGCEETELSIRASAHTGGTILQIPGAEVGHLVTADRVTWAYFRSRCWAEGLSKAIVGRHVGTDSALQSERAYTAKILPTGVLHGLIAAAQGDPAGLRRAGAIIAGLAITTAGYARGRLAVAIGR